MPSNVRRIGSLLVLIVSLGSCASPQDEAISHSVKHALIEYRPANLTRVDVSTDRGTVYLSGEVQNKEQKERAEAIARETQGVKQVINKLQVLP